MQEYAKNCTCICSVIITVNSAGRFNLPLAHILVTMSSIICLVGVYLSCTYTGMQARF